MASASDYTSLVQTLYISYFGRPADYFGLQNFEAALNAANAPTNVAGLISAYSTNSAVKSLIDSFGTSAESTALYGSGSTEQFVSSIFENILNRKPELSGLLFWTNAINSGQLTKGCAALAITAGGLSSVLTSDTAVITNKIATATYFTECLANDTQSIIGYSGAEAASQARSLLASVTATSPIDHSTVSATLANIIYGKGLNHPAPLSVTETVDRFSPGQTLKLDGDFQKASAVTDSYISVPGYTPGVLSYTISDSGEISFKGTLSNSLTVEQKAGNAAAILANMPNSMVTFAVVNSNTGKADTYVVTHGSGNPAPSSLIDIVGVNLHGFGQTGLIVQGTSDHWSS